MKSISRNKITLNSENTELDAKIYNARNDENFGIIDDGDYFVIYKIKNITTKIPSLNDVGFENEIRNFLFNKNKFEYNKKILKLINEGKFQERSQDLPKSYYDSGTFVIFPKPFISGLDMEGTDKGYLGYKLSKVKAIDIDTQEDWDLAEALYKIRNY